MMDVKSPKAKTLGDWENLIYVNEMELKTVHNDEKGDW